MVCWFVMFTFLGRPSTSGSSREPKRLNVVQLSVWGAILDEGHVRALMTIPEGTLVALRTVGGGLLLELEGLLEVHAVEIIVDVAWRRAVPPVDLVGFAKFVNDWSDLRGLSLLRTHGPRFAVASPVSAGADSAGGRRWCWCACRCGT